MRRIDVRGKCVLVIGIGRSLLSPHMIKYDFRKESARFWMRGTLGKQYMMVDELRRAFGLSKEWLEVAREFRERRVNIVSEVLGEGRVAFLFHLIPLGRDDLAMDVENLRGPAKTFIEEWEQVWDGCETVFNLDGLKLSCPNLSSPFYYHFFRNGAVECLVQIVSEVRENIPYLDARGIESYLGDGKLEALIGLLKDQGFFPPISIQLSLTGAKGYKLAHRTDHLGRPFEKNVVLIPDVTYYGSEQLAGTMKPVFDTLWQAAGYSSCPGYSKRHGLDSDER